MMNTGTKELIEKVWPLSTERRLFNGDRANLLTPDAYCAYSKRNWYAIAQHSEGSCVALKSQSEICHLIQQLQADVDRPEILANLKSQSPGLSDEACESSIDLAARLLLMLKFGIVKHQAVPRGHLVWTRGSLRDFVRNHFRISPNLGCEGIRLPKTFNAWTVEMVAGIEIRFTDNLADHLLLVEDDSKLLIFHHASFLERQHESMFPDGLANETLRTLALLFPQSEFRTANSRILGSKPKWFRKVRQDHSDIVIDPRLILCGNLKAEDRQIESFHFWRDRLVILKQAYDDATPQTVSQWWHDRRNGVQWYTFWVAIVVLAITTFLGVVQCVEGGLQAYNSFVRS
ncbi:hypothetical protein BJ166DRAFT_473213 [Pestalotiopsis sp. NC0098]|nr:hypothetical protein BJ166DRAFT_473213 [Pestalotiopsis sp. NC0098]